MAAGWRMVIGVIRDWNGAERTAAAFSGCSQWYPCRGELLDCTVASARCRRVRRRTLVALSGCCDLQGLCRQLAQLALLGHASVLKPAVLDALPELTYRHRGYDMRHTAQRGPGRRVRGGATAGGGTSPRGEAEGVKCVSERDARRGSLWRRAGRALFTQITENVCEPAAPRFACTTVNKLAYR